MAKAEQITDLKTLDDLLESESMRGLWVSEERYFSEPQPFGTPKLWQW